MMTGGSSAIPASVLDNALHHASKAVEGWKKVSNECDGPGSAAPTASLVLARNIAAMAGQHQSP